VRCDFEGGQMPLTRRIPKRGFNNARFRDDVVIISIAALEKHFENGAEVTRALLVDKGLIKGAGLLKILGGSELSKKLTVIADKFSKTAEQSIKAAGGEVRFL
jgi:large subunit ribosomal protein L15